MMHFSKSCNSLFLFLIMVIFLFSVTPEAFGWSGSTGGDDSPMEITTDKRTQEPGKLKSDFHIHAIEPGDIYQPRLPGATIKPGDATTPQMKDLPSLRHDLGEVIPPDMDDK